VIETLLKVDFKEYLDAHNDKHKIDCFPGLVYMNPEVFSIFYMMMYYPECVLAMCAPMLNVFPLHS